MHAQYTGDAYTPQIPLAPVPAPTQNAAFKATDKTTASSAQFHIPVQIQFLDGSQELLAAEIRRVNSGFMRLSLSVHIKTNRSFEVLYAGRRIPCEVAYCEKQQSKTPEYHLGAQMIRGGGIRREPRLPVDLPAKLDCPGAHALIAARVVDLSSSGLGLELPIPVPVGTMVSLDLGYGIAFGEIRHCTMKAKHRYRAGFLLEEFISRDCADTAAISKQRFDRPALGMFSTISKGLTAVFTFSRLRHRVC